MILIKVNLTVQNVSVTVICFTPTDRPKSVRNRCVIEVFGGVFYVVTLLFGFFCGCIGVCHKTEARCSGAEVAGWTLDRKIRVRFPAHPHRVWALWWQGGKRRLLTSRCPCRGRRSTLKTPSCPWRGCPAAGQNLETGHLSRHYIADISLNVTLNHNQHQHKTESDLFLFLLPQMRRYLNVASDENGFVQAYRDATWFVLPDCKWAPLQVLNNTSILGLSS